MPSSEVGHDFSEGSYELPETKFAKEPKDEIGESTEEEHAEMSGWLEDYLLTDLKEKMKHKATQVREKRTRKTLKGKSKVEFHKTLSNDFEEEILETDDLLLSKDLQRIDRMNEKISKTSEDIRRMPTSSRSPPTKTSPFVPRESSAFATLTEVCGGALGARFDINVNVEYPKPKRIVFLPSAILAQFWFLLVFENPLFLPFPPVIG